MNFSETEMKLSKHFNAQLLKNFFHRQNLFIGHQLDCMPNKSMIIGSDEISFRKSQFTDANSHHRIGSNLELSDFFLYRFNRNQNK